MKLIKTSFNPISLSKLIELHEQGITPKHAVAVTFDDGYSDFADYVFPILKKEGVPATLFITTGFVNGDIWLWPDKIKYLISQKKYIKLPTIGDLDGGVEIVKSSLLLWTDIANYCLTLENWVKEAYIADVFRLNDVCLPKKAPDGFKAVSWKQLRSILTEGVVDIGSHTCTHPVLTRINKYELRYELEYSKTSILCNLGVDTLILCYPNGMKSDFNDKVKKELLASGYKYGVAAYPALDPLGDVFSLGRYSVDKDHDRFHKTVYGISYLSAVIRRGVSSNEC